MALIRPDKMAVTAFMRIVFSRAEREIIADINRMRVRELVDYGAQAALRRVQGVLGDMVDESWSYVPTAVERVFTDASHAAGYASAEALSATQTAVCEQLVSNLLGQIDEAAEAAFSTTQKVIEIGRLSGDVYREKTLGAVLHQEATGKGFQASAGDVVRQWNAGGITAFTDRAGRKWSLTDYGTMATRTTAAQAQNAAVLTTYPGDLWQISRIGSTCPVCAVYEGRVYSRSGTNPDYPPLSAAFGKIDPAGTDDLTNTYLEIHPNCNHALIPYTTMGKTQREIKKDKDFSSFEKNPVTKDPRTEEQRKAYQDKVDRRRRYLETKHQYERYREALPDDMPKTLATFERHKRLDDDKYKEWQRKYRKKGAELRKEIKAQEMIPNPAPPTVTILGGREMPPNTWQFSNIGDFRKAEAAYIERHGREQYYALRKMQENHTSEWRIPAWDEDRDIKMERAIRFDDTITKLKERFPLPDGGNLTAGDFDSVQSALTATQRERAAGTAAAQAWLNPNTNENVIGYRMTHGGTLADDLAVREKAITEGRVLTAVFEKDSAEGIAIHEYGHRMAAYIENAMIYNDPAALEYWEWYKALSEKEIQDGISRYATTNRAEFEAECFADLLTGTPRPLARKYGEFLKRCAASNYTIKGELTGKGTPVQLNFNRGK